MGREWALIMQERISICLGDSDCHPDGGRNEKAPAFSQGFAPQVGLEPTTYGLTVRRSNRLSY